MAQSHFLSGIWSQSLGHCPLSPRVTARVPKNLMFVFCANSFSCIILRALKQVPKTLRLWFGAGSEPIGFQWGEWSVGSMVSGVSGAVESVGQWDEWPVGSAVKWGQW